MDSGATFTAFCIEFIDRFYGFAYIILEITVPMRTDIFIFLGFIDFTVQVIKFHDLGFGNPDLQFIAIDSFGGFRNQELYDNRSKLIGTRFRNNTFFIKVNFVFRRNETGRLFDFDISFGTYWKLPVFMDVFAYRRFTFGPLIFRTLSIKVL